MTALDDETEAWAVKTLEGAIGPQGTAALGVVLKSLRAGIREDMQAGQAKLETKIEAVRTEMLGLVKWVVTTFVALLVVAVGLAGLIVHYHG